MREKTITVSLYTFSLYTRHFLQKVQDKLVMTLRDRHRNPIIVTKLVVVFLFENFFQIEITEDSIINNNKEIDIL